VEEYPEVDEEAVFAESDENPEAEFPDSDVEPEEAVLPEFDEEPEEEEPPESDEEPEEELPPPLPPSASTCPKQHIIQKITTVITKTFRRIAITTAARLKHTRRVAENNSFV
jgi:hypothetical protein